tara:strand:+ start:226 stop:681 length:456 start_codon:yes stop_codon:yes gene_type:complete
MSSDRISQDDYFEERLDNQIDWYDRKSIQSQRWFKRLQVIVIVSSATIPFLSGYMDSETLYLKIAIGILGLVIAAITAVLGLYQFQENWLEYRTTCETLRHEKYLFLAKAAPYNEEEPFLLLVERVEGLISKENTNWQSYMKKSNLEKSNC